MSSIYVALGVQIIVSLKKKFTILRNNYNKPEICFETKENEV